MKSLNLRRVFEGLAPACLATFRESLGQDPTVFRQNRGYYTENVHQDRATDGGKAFLPWAKSAKSLGNSMV
jgi:hypothetical protein